ncbi:MAG: hypothetical protein ACXWM7_01055 [Parachlamydiaceae bacterium]
MKLNLLFLYLFSLFCCSASLIAIDIEVQEGKRSIIGERALTEVEDFELEEARASWSKLFSDQGCFSFSSAQLSNVDEDMPFTKHPGGYHNAMGFSGNRVGLEDGSWWTIYSKDLPLTRNWLTSANSLVPDALTIAPNLDWPNRSSYRYCLTNQQTGVAVKVNMALSPTKDGLYSHYILSSTWLIDDSGYFYVQLLLNDGSLWNMPPPEFAITCLWHIDDLVIIGNARNQDGDSPSNILINVATNNYAIGYCLKY